MTKKMPIVFDAIFYLVELYKELGIESDANGFDIPKQYFPELWWALKEIEAKYQASYSLDDGETFLRLSIDFHIYENRPKPKTYRVSKTSFGYASRIELYREDLFDRSFEKDRTQIYETLNDLVAAKISKVMLG